MRADDTNTRESFPRQAARTQRFTLGEPRNIAISGDGRRVSFLRSAAGDDGVNALWVLDSRTGDERLVADPRALLGDDAAGDLSPEEMALRERARESAGGITAYATDAAGTVAAFALAGRLFGAGLISGRAREIVVDGPVFDPRPDPTARRIAYVRGAELRVAELDGSSSTIAGPEPSELDSITWGSADFIAAEEMHRFRGYWWSPDGERIAVCRVDDGPVDEWVIADPAHPDRPARTVRYPAAGTSNPVVTLHLVDLDGDRVDVEWDREYFPYLASVRWNEHGLLLHVQARDQRGTMTLLVDETSGTTEVLGHDSDEAWVELVPGAPRLVGPKRLVTAADVGGARRLVVDGDPVTPTDLQVRSIVDADADSVTFTANPIDDATVLHVWRWQPASGLTQLVADPGISGATVGGGVTVVRTSTLDVPGSRTTVLGGPEIASYGETPVLSPNVEFSTTADRDIAVALLLPHDHDGSELPVLLDPYGGPHALRAVRSHNALVASQWFADQGFAVVVADGRGTPGRGSSWERAVHRDLASAPLDDQIEALHHVAERAPFLDLQRVAIRGWSFGGYLAALAVLRRPDVFAAAIAGAPVTDWRLYDTHYTERYLGNPASSATSYEDSSLIGIADRLERPLLIVHGLADDNVVAAHSLRLSSALLESGRPHEFLPLAGVTHMTSKEVVAENLLFHQLDFLRRALAVD